MSVTAVPPRTLEAAGAAADGLDVRLVATIPPVLRHLLAHARRRAAWRRLTYQQYNVLRIVQNEGPVGQAEIARRLLVTAPVVTRLASSLVEAGLAERGRDPRDRRAVRLSLTASGRRRVQAMRRALLEAATELLDPLPADRRAAIGAALDELQVLVPPRGTAR
jgi:DNA-binding MarR family transcriptional regulator